MESDCKPVVFSKTIADAKERCTAFIDATGIDKNQVYVLDLEAEEPAQKAKNTTAMESLNDPDSKLQIKAIFTDETGLREISYWDQCVPIAWYDLKTKTNYEQFLGRSNRQFPTQLQQRVIIITENADKMTREKFERRLSDE